MRILITNDDGIHSPGLDVCAEIARALSLNDPLRLRQVEERRFAVKGTPTDCVVMGVRHILNGKGPDLVLSGVNRGRNVAEDVTYSGTIAGAIEGTILGIPSFALSLSFSSASRQKPYWETAVRFGPEVIRKVLAAGIPRGVLINVNFPDCAPAEVRGVASCTQGHRGQAALLKVEARH